MGFCTGPCKGSVIRNSVWFQGMDIAVFALVFDGGRFHHTGGIQRGYYSGSVLVIVVSLILCILHMTVRRAVLWIEA